MKFLVFFLLFYIRATFSFAQLSCDCSANLSRVIEQTQVNYAGYPAKVNSKTVKQYDELVGQLKRESKTINLPKKCYPLLKSYVNFFADKHFRIEYMEEPDSSVIHMDIKKWKEKVAGNVSTVEGIYTNPEKTSQIAIVKQGKNYKGIKINSNADNYPPGFVYFTLTPNGRNFSVKEFNRNINITIPGKLQGNLFTIWNFACWGKVYPQQMTKQEEETLSSWANNNNGLQFKKLENDVAYLKIPSFSQTEQQLQALVIKNDSVIRNSAYLIIDLRGNGGGNTGWVHLLPYLMTKPIVQEDTYLRISAENIRRKLPDLAYYVNNPIPAEYKKYFPDTMLARYKKTFFELPVTQQSFYPIPGVNFWIAYCAIPGKLH
jgi:hypothetical protein